MWVETCTTVWGKRWGAHHAHGYGAFRLSQFLIQTDGNSYPVSLGCDPSTKIAHTKKKTAEGVVQNLSVKKRRPRFLPRFSKEPAGLMFKLARVCFDVF